MGLRAAHEAMQGKVAVVVGGAAGHLGRGTTLGLAREGVRLIVCDNDREGLEAIVGEVEALGSTVTAIYGDVMDPATGIRRLGLDEQIAGEARGADRCHGRPLNCH